MFRPPRPLRETIAGPAGSLEILIEDPADATSAPPLAYGVVCHPHPQMGGTMNNKVVHTVARALQEAGLPTIRFNYRGVGESAGAYDEGRGETQDALAVAAFGAARWPGAALWLAGFSFGGFVAIDAARSVAPARLIAVAPAVSRFENPESSGPQCPWLVIQGDADEVIDASAVLAWADMQQPRPRIAVVAGASHFFHGRLPDLREAALGFARG